MGELLGVIVGGLIAFGAAVGVKLWDEARFRSSLRAAFRAEITSILEIAERRQYEEHFQTYIDLWKKGQDLHKWPTIIGAQETQHHPVAEENVSHLGQLGPDAAADIVRFYSMVTAIQTDITAGARNQLHHMGIDERIALVEQDLGLWREAKVLGDDLIKSASDPMRTQPQFPVRVVSTFTLRRMGFQAVIRLVMQVDFMRLRFVV